MTWLGQSPGLFFLALAVCAVANAGAEEDVAADAGDATPVETIPLPPALQPKLDPPPTALPTDEIVVTATKRPEVLRRIPASIDVLDGQALQSKGANQLRDYLRAVPGVGLTEIETGLYRISIRGVDADVTAVTAPTSGVLINDIPLSDPFFSQVRPDISPFDLEAVEVLKGPQGTLFGGSALAGAVRYRLADAKPGVWETSAAAGYQDVEEGDAVRTGSAMVNVPIGADAALRVAGTRRLSGGVIDDLRTGERDTDRVASGGARALLRWDASERLSARLLAMTDRVDSDDRPYTENADGRLEREQTIGRSPGRSEFDLYGIDVNYEWPWATLVVSNARLRKYGASLNAGGERFLGVQQAGQPVQLPTTADIDGWVHELRLVSPGISAEMPWQWLVGAFAYRYSGFTTQQAIAEISQLPAGVPLSPSLPGLDVNLADFSVDADARELALFGEVTRDLGRRWKLTLGARGYDTRSEGQVRGSGALVLAGGATETRNDARVKSSGVNPKVALRYEFSEQASAYASAARGFRFGGVQLAQSTATSPDVPLTYKSDTLWSYELGWRSRWLDSALVLDGALFYIDWDDAQVRTTTGGVVPLNVIDNVGAARSRGAELALRYSPARTGPNAQLAAAYTDARTTTPFVGISGNEVPRGARLPGTPKVQATAVLGYVWDWDGARVDASLAHTYVGTGVSDIEQSRRIYDYQSTDASVSLETAALPGHPKLTFGVSNLADERAVVSAFVIDADNLYAVYNRPRAIWAQLELRL